MKEDDRYLFETLITDARDLLWKSDDSAQLALLLDALQGFVAGDLGAVVRTSGSQQFTHYSQPVAEMRIDDEEVAKLLNDCGVRLKGEACYIRFDRRHPRLQRLREKLLRCLELMPNDDPVARGWRPPYWDDPGFLAALNTPCIEYLGDSRLPGFMHQYPLAPYLHAPWSPQEKPIHHMGGCMRWVRLEQSMSGSLPKVRRLLMACRRHDLWATALVPPEWEEPEGIPQAWATVVSYWAEKLGE